MESEGINFYALAETTNAAVFVYQDQQNCYVNTSATAITGYSRDELLDMFFWDVVHPDFQESIKRDGLARQQGKPVPTRREVMLLTKSGEGRCVDVVLSTVELWGATAVLGTAFDITGYKQMEKALRLSEAKYRAILESAPDAIVIINSDEYITLVNAKTEELFGFSRSELLGKPIELLLPSYKRQANAQQSNTGLIFRPYLRDMKARFELSGAHKDGRSFPVAIKLSPLELEDGLHVTCIIRDITDYKHAEKQAIDAERLAVLGRLTAVLAHEINNPIQIIQGYVDLILDFQLEADEVRRHLQLICDEIGQLKDINQRVLNYANPQPAPRQRVIIAELIEQVLLFVDELLRKSGVQVATDLQEAPPVMATPNQLMQVFLNLIVNVIEAITDGGALHIALHAEDDQVYVSFMNDGPAIPPAIMPRIFEPFFTTKSNGNGLGLWVSHNLVQQHGGLLTARNLPDEQGVVFTVILPAIIDGKS